MTNNTAVVEFSRALEGTPGAHTPAALTESLVPVISESFWLQVSSNSIIKATEFQVLRMILERSVPQGVSIALTLDWQPQRWGLPAGAAPTVEVLRRFQLLAQAAQLISCSAIEAEHFWTTPDPALIRELLPQSPAVIVRESDGGLSWSIGGRQGRLDAALLDDPDGFLAGLLARLGTHPQLLGGAAPGIDALADPDALSEQLLAAASTQKRPLMDSNHRPAA